jgi:hypothetical protein
LALPNATEAKTLDICCKRHGSRIKGLQNIVPSYGSGKSPHITWSGFILGAAAKRSVCSSGIELPAALSHIFKNWW